MLLKILLLQVMSIGLITVPIKAQDSLVAIPDIYMEEDDKAVMNSIWNMAGFPSDQGGPTDVDRKFFATVSHAVPVLHHPIVQQIPIIQPAISTYVPTMSPGYGVGVPLMPGNLHQQMNDNRQDKRITQTGSTYTGSPTTINYKVLPKPPNSELDSSEEDDSPGLINNRRTLNPENADLEITDDNDKETYSRHYPTENLKPDAQDLQSADLAMERMQRMMQFEGADDNIHKNSKLRNFLGRNSHQNIKGDGQSHDTNADVDMRSKTSKYSNLPEEEDATMNRYSHMGILNHYMHKKSHDRNTANTTRNSETSTHHPTVTNEKYTEIKKESIRKSNKTPESKYYEMLENNQKYLCKCDLTSDQTMKDSRPRRTNEDFNDRNSYTERSMDFRHGRSFNCTKYCSFTEENDAKTIDKDILRMRGRHDKGIYHKDKRNNEDDDSGDKESVESKATHSRKYRNKHTLTSYGDDSSYRSMRNVNPSDYMAASPAEVLRNVEGYNPMMLQYPNVPQTYMFGQLRGIRSTVFDATQVPYMQNKVTE